MDQTVAIILGGGRGTRLHPLTKHRSKPAVPFGGMYRLIDIPVSNCLNSGVYRIFVVTQFNSASLNRHVALTYNFDAFREGYVTVLAAEQTLDSTDWFQGTADAVRKNLRHLRPTQATDALILSGDHIYRMDYRVMLALHRQARADVTIAAVPVTAEQAQRFGILKMNSEGRVVEFMEKPSSREAFRGWELGPAMSPGDGGRSAGPVYLASMGIYIIRFDAMEDLLQHEGGSDFGKHVIPRAIHHRRVYAYPFSGYWEDIGTIQSYYDANLALTDEHPRYELYDSQMRLFTRPRFLPGARLHDAQVKRTLVCGGAHADRVTLEHSIIGARAIIRSGVTVSDSILVGADYYESPETLNVNRESGRPDVGIGGDSTIRRAIVDKNARIGYGVTIDPGAGAADMDGDGYCVRDGLVIVEKDAVIHDGMRIPTQAR
ncbi:glucose-1-phosphate adenylyltransferase [candidate division KSB1 bacterium]|nr:glucose-1-phosphate adenylyltransferase [candidate division KSB1 bacterium]